MNRLFKPGGAISVFLVIILVPCLVLTFLFVDLSRVELARTMVASSADMAMNSLCANYDEVLNEYYGLVASCQNIDEFYDETEKYFKATLTASGLGDAAADNIVSYVLGEINSDGAQNVIRVKALEDSVSIAPVDGASLGENQALLKENIVEFMKYRAPVLMLDSLIDMLQNSGDDLSNLEESAEDGELADKRDEFAEAEGELSAAEFYTFYYYDKYKKLEPTKAKLEETQTASEDWRKSYEEICKYVADSLWISDASAASKPYVTLTETIKDVETGNPKDGSWKYFGRTGSSTQYSALDFCYGYTSTETGVVLKCDVDTVFSQMEKVNTKKAELESLILTANSTANTYNNMVCGKDDNQYSEAQWYYFAWKAISPSVTDIQKKANELADELVKLKAMTVEMQITAESYETFPSDYNNRLNAAMSAENYMNSYTKSYTASGAYMSLLNKLVTSYNNNIMERYNQDKVIVSNTGASVNSTLSGISTEFMDKYTQISSYVDALNIVIDGDGDKVKSLDTVAGLVDDYKYDYDAYKTEAYSGSGSSGEGNLHTVCQDEIETNYENASGGINRNITSDDVRNFKQKLVNVRNIYQGMMSDMEAIMFGNSSIASIGSYSSFYTEFDDVFTVPTAPQTNKTIADNADNAFKELFKPSATEELITVPDNTDASADYRLILKEGDDTYYDFMLSQKYNVSDLDSLENEVSGQESKLDAWKDQAEEAEDDKDKKEGGADSIPDFEGASSGRASDGFSIGTTITAFVELLNSLTDLNGDSVRDAIYVTLYADEMFSCRTYDYEGQYALLDDKTEVNLSNYKEKYETVSEAWSDTEKTFVNNKSLTNQMINSDNNYAFGGELEYILYGGTAKANYTCAYEDIFVIRYVMNFASGFQNFYNRNTKITTSVVINSVADAISSATYGIVPAPLVKCIIIALLATLETVNDMSRLLAGLPVELYKTKPEYWQVSFDGDDGGAKDNGQPGTNPNYKEPTSDTLTLQYSDYIFMFLYFGFQSQNSGMYKRMGNAIQENMKKRGESSFSLDKSYVLFKMTADLEVEPLMMDTPLASDYNSDILEAVDWRSFKLEMIRGY